jgi:hypothetical protein
LKKKKANARQRKQENLSLGRSLLSDDNDDDGLPLITDKVDVELQSTGQGAVALNNTTSHTASSIMHTKKQTNQNLEVVLSVQGMTCTNCKLTNSHTIQIIYQLSNPPYLSALISFHSLRSLATHRQRRSNPRHHQPRQEAPRLLQYYGEG